MSVLILYLISNDPEIDWYGIVPFHVLVTIANFSYSAFVCVPGFKHDIISDSGIPTSRIQDH